MKQDLLSLQDKLIKQASGDVRGSLASLGNSLTSQRCNMSSNPPQASSILNGRNGAGSPFARKVTKADSNQFVI